MRTEIQYRTFDELLDSVRIDVRTYDLEGNIDPQQLIKVAQRVNFELGLKINPSRSKMITVYNGKAKLPSDFYVLNFALLCNGKDLISYPTFKYSYKTYEMGVIDGKTIMEDEMKRKYVQEYVTAKVIAPGPDNLITHNLGTTNVVVQVFEPSTNTVLDFEIQIINKNQLKIISNLAQTVNTKVVVMGAQCSSGPDGTCTGCCPQVVNSPTSLPSTNCTLGCNDSGNNCVTSYANGGLQYQYTNLIPIKIEKSKSVSVDCFNIDSKYYYAGILKNGFLDTNFDDGEVYINYQSLMEDDQGNLLVMSHPLVDEFYEYALKQRIYENLLMAGDNVSSFLQLIEQRLRAARNNALSYINTPDFKEMLKNWEMNRKAMYHNYYNMFKSAI
jgi:hypothetical protein